MKPTRLGSGICLWIVTLGLIFTIGVAIRDAHAAGSSISGRVVDSVTGAGIQDVTVLATNGSQVGYDLTDATGGFLVSDLADGAYMLSFIKNGYVSLMGGTAVSVTVTGDTPIPVPISMTSTGGAPSISGRVLDWKTNAGLMDVTVTVTDASKNVAGSKLTDASGNFSVSLAADGLYYLNYAKTGYTAMAGSQAIPVVVMGGTASSVYMAPTTGLSLAPGWNFVSLAGVPSGGTNISDVLSDVSSNVRIVWGYDNRTKRWLKFQPSGQNNSLLALQPGLGYWVYMDKADFLDTSWWMQLMSHSVPVYSGWNLLGYNGPDNADGATALNTIAGKWSILWTWDNDAWYAKSAALLNLPVPSIANLNRGKAYWIKGSVDTKWFQVSDAPYGEWVIGSVPADNASNLSLLGSMQVQMWNDMDASTVNKNGVTLFNNGEFGSSRILGSTGYDDMQHLVTFQPGGSLAEGSELTLKLNAGVLRDTSGNAMFDDYTVYFSTMRNQLKKYIDYKPDGTVKEYGIYEFDTNGNLSRHIHYEDAGGDGLWFTSDDVVSYYETYSMAGLYGVFGMKIRYDDPGNDGVWFTGDDQGLGPNPAYDITGALGIQIKGDRPPFTSTYSHDHTKTYRITQGTFGNYQMDYSYNTDGYLTRIAFGDSTATGVDRYTLYENEYYNGDNLLAREVSYGGPGADNQWFVGDDEVLSYSAYTYDGKGVLTQIVKYNSPGLNGNWFDADDVASFCTRFIYGVNRLLIQSEYYGNIVSAGVPCTGTLYQYTAYAYDAQGRKTGDVRYGGPGPDGTWFTGDDLPLTAYEYDTTW